MVLLWLETLLLCVCVLTPECGFLSGCHESLTWIGVWGVRVDRAHLTVLLLMRATAKWNINISLVKSTNLA